MFHGALWARVAALGLVVGAVVAAQAQWNPSQGDWGKENPDDIRIMTYNIQDNICSRTDKSEAFDSWHALARIIAAMRPDVLILQETGDNSGNGTPGGGDTVSELTTTCELFIHGGTDPFLGGTVGSYVQKYAPGYDLPYIFASSISDGYNRNVILSRFPFTDLNGDGKSQISDIAYVYSHLYAPGGTGGVRGFAFAEIDLPDNRYNGDLVVGNAHLKAYGGTAEHNQRVTAAKNVAYYIDHIFNGGGVGTVDPYNKILDSPAIPNVLDAFTPVVMGGDWNEDETKSWSSYGDRGPAGYLTQAGTTGGTDGTDRDRSDMTYDSATEPYSGDRSTQSSSKLDYLAWQDGVATLRRAFIFNSNKLAAVPSWIPSELNGYPYSAALCSGKSSDHRPVIIDLIMPGVLSGDYDVNVSITGNGAVDFDPPGGSYPAFTDVELTADPDPGNYFIRWEGDLTGTVNPETVNITSDMNITAVFDTSPPPTYTVTTGASGNGTVVLDPPGGSYTDGSEVEFTAVADPGWAFIEWQGDLAGTVNPRDVAIDGNMSVTAVFTEVYTLSIVVSGDGIVNVTPEQAEYLPGTVVTLDPIPQNAGVNFVEWQGDLTGSDDPAQITMNSDMTITAVFAEPFPCGDVNCDGLVDTYDIDAFVLALSSANDYAAAYPGCDINNADTDDNGFVDTYDIDSFVAAIAVGNCP